MSYPENSRVWIYQSNRELNAAEVFRAEHVLHEFTADWTAHNHLLKSKAHIHYNRFFILTVDESQAAATGCSIDKSVTLIKSLEHEFHINLFDRFNIAYRGTEGIVSVSRNDFEDLIKEGAVNADTIVFNNLVNNLKDFATKWEVPYKNSWHKQVFGNLVAV